MTYEFTATSQHDEIAKHINKALGKRLSGEQVAMVLEGAKDFRATAKERAEEARNAKKAKKIADLKAQLAALTGAEIELATKDGATVTPIKPAKKAAAPAKKGTAKKVAQAEKDKAAKKSDVDEADIRKTPPGAEPIAVVVEEDAFETVGGESETDEDWDDAFGSDEGGSDDDAEDF